MRNAMKSGNGTGARTTTGRRHRRAAAAIMEAVEPRRLQSATVTSTTGDTISDISGSYFGSVLFGDNGFSDGMPTGLAGADGSADACSFNTWDSNVDDGVDSDFVDFNFSVNTGGTGGGTFAVDNSDTSTFSAGSDGGIQHVTIQADVAGAYLEMEWQNVTVNFYRGGQLVETVNVGSLSAGALDGTTGGPAEALATVTASASDYDGVSVTAKVRLCAAQGIYPSPNDIFGQVTIS